MRLRELFKGLYRRCGCGRSDCLIPIINKRGEFIKCKRGHTTTDRRGYNNPNYKGGRKKDKDGYWHLLMPNYPKVNSFGYIREHIYFYQEKNKLCMLEWGDVHHIEPITKDYCNNMPWNLQGIMKKQHTSYHRLGRHKDTSKYRCFLCKNNKTIIEKPNKNNKTPIPRWFHLPHDKINWYCNICYKKEYYKRRKKKI